MRAFRSERKATLAINAELHRVAKEHSRLSGEKMHSFAERAIRAAMWADKQRLAKYGRIVHAQDRDVDPGREFGSGSVCADGSGDLRAPGGKP
jgi:hypothetical protein